MNTLLPFKNTSFTQKYKIQASFLQKSPFEIHLEFHLEGPVSALLLPSPEEPQRLDKLWESTCLEAFLEKHGGAYLEINCSPNGHWNAYEFDSYRHNARPAPQVSVRLTRLEKEAGEARFFIQVVSEQELTLKNAGLTMVLESSQHEKSYWALLHPSEKPDFHRAEGWTLSATPATH